jgi:transcription elongation factor Elf1
MKPEKKTPQVIEVKSEPVPIAVKKIKYFECPFCGEVDTVIRNIDPTSSWCGKCGKCFQVVWKEK